MEFQVGDRVRALCRSSWWAEGAVGTVVRRDAAWNADEFAVQFDGKSHSLWACGRPFEKMPLNQGDD